MCEKYLKTATFIVPAEIGELAVHLVLSVANGCTKRFSVGYWKDAKGHIIQENVAEIEVGCSEYEYTIIYESIKALLVHHDEDAMAYKKLGRTSVLHIDTL